MVGLALKDLVGSACLQSLSGLRRFLSGLGASNLYAKLEDLLVTWESNRSDFRGWVNGFRKLLSWGMHYGHPDFLDGFWASNRGSLSKASPAINLSEDRLVNGLTLPTMQPSCAEFTRSLKDIFAGFNVRMRGHSAKWMFRSDNFQKNWWTRYD